MLLTLIKNSEFGYAVNYENMLFIGMILQKEDGFFDFYPDLKGGYWASYVLRELADILDKLNKPWQDIINNDPSIAGPQDIQLSDNESLPIELNKVGYTDEVG